MTNYSRGSTTASYVYNGDGLRTGKTVNGIATAEVWDTAGSMPMLIQDGSTNYIVGPTGLPLEQINGTAVTWYYQDQLGSTRGLLDGTGTIVGTYTYTAYGTVASHTGSATTPFGYAGQYTDAESGLQYLRARYYDPATQQFLTVDPLVGLTGQPYGYAGDAPTSATDPTGLMPGVAPGGGSPCGCSSGPGAIGTLLGYAPVTAAVLGVAAAVAIVFLPEELVGVAVGLGVAAELAGIGAAVEDYQNHDWAAFALDLAGEITGLASLRYARSAFTLARASQRLLAAGVYAAQRGDLLGASVGVVYSVLTGIARSAADLASLRLGTVSATSGAGAWLGGGGSARSRPC